MPSTDDLSSLVRQLESQTASSNHQASAQLLTKAKVTLLHQNALIPSSSTSPKILAQAQYVLELGALISIRAKAPEAFTTYFQQLQPFYNDSATQQHARGNQQSKITGLYLLLLLSKGDYSGFHTLLESLESAAAEAMTKSGGQAKGLDDDEFVQYPIRLESWLTEGSYDRVWEETKSERVPSEEFSIFSEILVDTIRSEVASCSEKAYGSLPVMNAKNLLFLDSEGSVLDFSNERGWQAKDGRVHFPAADVGPGEDDILGMSGQIIDNTLGYARELETIV